MHRTTIAMLGNLYFDTRTYNLFKTLNERNYYSDFIGFDWLTFGFKSVKKDNVKIFNIKKGRLSILFYLKFAIILISNLLAKNSGIFWAADVYSLPFVLFAAKIKKAKVFYDAREIYAGLDALTMRPFVQKIITAIEEYCIKRVDYVFTTGPMDSDYIENLYRIKKSYLLRNFPLPKSDYRKVDYHDLLKLNKNIKVLLYQGIIVAGRGLETIFAFLKESRDYCLVILGGGEHAENYKKMVSDLNLQDRVFFLGKFSQEHLISYTAGAYAGLSLIDDTSINNHYALPNKVFEYIMAEIPIIVTDLPQLKKVVEDYQVGLTVKDRDADSLKNALKLWENNEYLYIKQKDNCKIVSKELNWEVEFNNVEFLFRN